MGLYNLICENAMHFGDKVLGTNMGKSFDFLMKSQWWTRDEIVHYQNRRLRALITHAYVNVPFYRQRMDATGLIPSDIRSSVDLKELPLLRKEEIRENFPNGIVARNYHKSELLLGGSSGSTGQPLQYYKTKQSLGMVRAANLRGWYWTGFRLGDPYMKIATMPRNSLPKKTQDWLNRSYYVHSRSISQSDIKHILDTIRDHKLKIVRGYPGSLYILASHLESIGDHSYHLKSIITTSEPLYPHLREKIERMFHCKIFDSYGAEGAPIIFECPTHLCYHISPEIAITEYIPDPDDSDRMRMIFTDLTNFATPFIRYDIGDYAKPGQGVCQCGRSMTQVSALEGRDTDVLLTPSGKYITFYFFAGYFEHKQYLDFFQMRQTSYTDFVLYIVPNKHFSQDVIPEVKRDILDVMGQDVNLRIEIVDDIPLTSSGKRRFFVREKSINLNI